MAIREDCDHYGGIYQLELHAEEQEVGTADRYGHSQHTCKDRQINDTRSHGSQNYHIQHDGASLATFNDIFCHERQCIHHGGQQHVHLEESDDA